MCKLIIQHQHNFFYFISNEWYLQLKNRGSAAKSWYKCFSWHLSDTMAHPKICVWYVRSCSLPSDRVNVVGNPLQSTQHQHHQQQWQHAAVDQSGSYSTSRAPHHTLHTRPRAVVGQGFDPQRLAQNIIHIYCSDGTGAEVRLEVWKTNK